MLRKYCAETQHGPDSVQNCVVSIIQLITFALNKLDFGMETILLAGVICERNSHAFGDFAISQLLI